MELSQSQISKAKEWYMNHSELVLNLFNIAQDENLCYPPTQEDASHPNLWKPAHWAWFMANYVFHYTF